MQNDENSSETTRHQSSAPQFQVFSLLVHFIFSSSNKPLKSFSYLPSCDPSWPYHASPRPDSPSKKQQSIFTPPRPHSSHLLVFFTPFHTPSSVKWECNELTLRAERRRVSGLSQENDLNKPSARRVLDPFQPLHHQHNTGVHAPCSTATAKCAVTRATDWPPIDHNQTNYPGGNSRPRIWRGNP